MAMSPDLSALRRFRSAKSLELAELVKQLENPNAHFGAFGSTTRKVGVMNPKELYKESASGHEREDEWSEVTRGERYIIRTTSEEANGAYSMLEVVADPR